MGIFLRILLLLAIGLPALVAPRITTAVLLLDEGFETDGDGVRYFASQTFNKGFDYWDRGELGDFDTLVPYLNPEGIWFWAAEDVNAEHPGGNGNDTQSIDFETIDISGFNDLEFSGLFASTANDFFGPGFPFHEPDDGIKVQYSIDGGPYVDGLCFARNVDSNMELDNGCDGSGDGGLLTADFMGASNPYGFSIPSGNTLDLRILVKADESSEELAFDSFQVVPEPGGVITLACGVMLLVLLTRWRTTSGCSSRRSLRSPPS